jgi:hypothetical protein
MTASLNKSLKFVFLDFIIFIPNDYQCILILIVAGLKFKMTM